MIRHYVIHPYLKIRHYVIHPTKYNIMLNFFQKKWDFYTIKIVDMRNDCMLSFTFSIDLLLKKYEYF